MTGYDNIEHASLTDVGVRRSHNQDAHATLLASDEAHWQGQGHMFLVADGMGAHAVGELASALAVSLIPHTYHKHAHQGAVAALRKAFVEANASIHARGQQNPEFHGMGTTTTALVLRPEGAWVGHVGDSRAYRVRDGHIEQLSFDHSFVWELARRQGVDPDTLRGIPSHVIVRSLGPEPLVQVDVEGPHPFHQGDIFLLCSDGLSGQVSDSEIGAIAGILPPAEACYFLVNLANLRGGPDNITVMIVRVGDRGETRPSEPAPPPSWYRRVPWPLGALFLGVVLAGGAATLFYLHLSVLGVLAFLLAGAAIVAGIVGLILLQAQEQRRQTTEAENNRRLHVYRKVACTIERPLVERLGRAAADLKQQIEPRNWEVDWPAYQQHRDLGQKLLSDGKPTEAFREYCRAMRPLMEAVQRYRNKGEVFKPSWD